MIVADKKLDKLVISIRGTLSISDLLTDMVARPVSLKAKVLEHVEKENLFLTNVERSMILINFNSLCALFDLFLNSRKLRRIVR